MSNKATNAGRTRGKPVAGPPVETIAPRQGRLIKLGEASSLYPISRTGLRRRIATGELQAYRLGRSGDISVDIEELDSLFRPVPSPTSWRSA